MKNLKIFILSVTILLFTLVGVGVAQNYYSNPIRGCREYEASSSYMGYDCHGKTIYMQK